jgi:phage terminase small subunit
MRAQAEYAERCAKTGADTMVLATKKGAQPSPHLTIVNRSTNTLFKLCAELGFSPLARANLRPTRSDDEQQAVEGYDLIVASRPN